MEEIKNIEVGSHVVSIEVIEQEIFCGLADKTICIINIDTLEKSDTIIKMKEVVKKFLMMPGNYNEYLICF